MAGDYRLSWWILLPWRCKLGRHKPLYHFPQYSDTDPPYSLGDDYYECSRCGSFLGYAEDYEVRVECHGRPVRVWRAR